MTIYNYSGPGGHVTIPAQIYGIPVTVIGDYIFKTERYIETTETIYLYLRNLISSVSIPDTVTYIGYNAFNNNKLTDIIIPDSVTFIEIDAFTNNNLSSIRIGENVKFTYKYTGSIFSDHAFDYNFDNFYIENGRKAGLYKRFFVGNDFIWILQ